MNSLNAFTVYLVRASAVSFLNWTANIITLAYLVVEAGFSPLQLVLVGTLLELAIFTFEVPTGVVADVYSRRLSVIIGTFLIGVGTLLTGLSTLFGVILFAQVVWGLGFTFTSGAGDAWIVDEVGEEKSARAFVRAAQWGQLASIAGIGTGIALGSLDLSTGLVLTGSGHFVLGIFLVLFMPESGFNPTPAGERNTFGSMRDTLRSGAMVVRLSPILIVIMLTSLIDGLYSEAIDRLWTAHVLINLRLPAIGNFAEVVWVGFIKFGVMGLTIMGTEMVRRRLEKNRHAHPNALLTVIYTFTMLGIFGFALAQNFWFGVAMYWVIMVTRSVGEPIYLVWINRHAESKTRATVLSMYSLLNAFGQIAGGPPLGVVGQVFSMRAALVASGFIIAPAIPLLARSRNGQGEKNTEEEASVPA